MEPLSITLPRPDDWHAHLRDGPILTAVAPASARIFNRVVVMPNLTPPVTSAALAQAYRERIVAQTRDFRWTPLMTCYLTDNADPADLEAGYRDGIFFAAKLYPAGATTNSDSGVTDIAKLDRTFEMMQSLRMPLLIHGEVVDNDVDVFDREAVFIERLLAPLSARYPELKIVLEHVTSSEGVAFVRDMGPNIAATITPHHLMINRNSLFRGGIRPHFYCLPIAKRERHRLALRAAATSGNPKFFLGTDTAPHTRGAKESDCGCAGVYNAPTAMACYAQVFDDEGQLDRLAGFASEYGARFYGLPMNDDHIVLRNDTTTASMGDIETPEGSIMPFQPEEPLRWQIVDDGRGAS